MSNIDLEKVLAENDGVVPQDIALQLLMELRSKNSSMGSLLDSDLETLSEVMDFLPFDSGDPLITKGESATWLGYIAMGGVDVIIGGNTVATMPPGKLLGGMGLFFGGTRTVDCGGAKSGGVIAALSFDSLKEMVEDTPKVAVRVYAAIAVGELQNLQGRLGEGKDDGGKKKKKGKKGRKMSVTASAKAEVLYRSKAAAASKERKKLKDKMDNLAKDEKKQKQSAKNEKLARMKLQKEIDRKDALLIKSEEEMEEVQEEMEELREEMAQVQKIKDELAQAKREIAALKKKLAAKGSGGGSGGGGGGGGGCSKAEEKELRDALDKANQELDKLRSHVCPSGGGGGNKEELLALKRSLALLKSKLAKSVKNNANDEEARQQKLQLETMRKEKAERDRLMKEMNDRLNASLEKNSMLEDLIKTLRERLASGGWTRARGEARNANLERMLSAAKTELERMNEKCGKKGVGYDQLVLDLAQNKQMEQVYFTNWLAESMHRMTLENQMLLLKQHCQDQLDAMRKLHAEEMAKMIQNYEAQLQLLKKEFDAQTSSGNAEFLNMKNQLNANMNAMKSKLLDQIKNMQQQHAGEVATLMAELSDVKHKNAELNALLQERNATILALTDTLKQTQALLQEANERSAALESTLTAALTRRRNELAVTLQRLADVTILFLHVSRRCEEMDNAFGVLGKKCFLSLSIVAVVGAVGAVDVAVVVAVVVVLHTDSSLSSFPPFSSPQLHKAVISFAPTAAPPAKAAIVGLPIPRPLTLTHPKKKSFPCPLCLLLHP